jgi:SAM-dependent methyltransferase
MKSNFKSVPAQFNPGLHQTAYLIRKVLLKAVAKHVHQLSGSIMDFGCGSKPYKSLFTVDEYVGVDYNGEGHSHVNESIDVFYDGVHLPFDDNRFDGIFSTEVFEHVFNLEDILKELNRVLKTGGKMLITCPFAICEHEQPVDFARYTSFGLKALLERNGFKVLEFDKAGSASQTISQLFISYFQTHIIRRVFGKIPVVRTAVSYFFMTVFNLLAIVGNLFYPKGDDLYMNNVVVVVKEKNLN